MIYKLRKAEQNDYDFLYELNKTSMKKYVEAIWGWDETLQQQMFQDKFVPDKYQIIEAENISIGTVQVCEEKKELFIGVIEIIPKYQNQGIGTSLIRTLLKQSKENQNDRVWLQVFKENSAIELYEKLGFQRIKETETHIIMEVVW